MARRRQLGSKAAYAAHRGCSRQAVDKAVRDGRIPMVDGQIDFDEADRLWRANTDPTKPSNTVTGNPDGAARRRRKSRTPESPAGEGGGGEETGEDGDSLHTAITVRAVYKAKRERIAYEIDAGLVISRADVRLAWYNRLRQFYERLLVIPDRTGKRVAVLSDARECSRLIRDEIVKAIEALGSEGDAGLEPGRPAARRRRSRGAAART